MKYMTRDEFEHFDFSEAYIQDIQVMQGLFHFYLDNVTILPENSCNRDIRKMRANNFVMKMEECTVEAIVEEGFQHYDADGKLLHVYEDAQVDPKKHGSVLKSFSEGMIYSASKQDKEYLFFIDGNDEKTYQLRLRASADVEEWDRFLNREDEIG
ncbi:MAG: subtilin biosynthesis sensor protein SpaK [Lachnospiraceae bacterium]|nr:subtilin biosynthesis sensor protein SpaK [Lachnospiraceae bacterium]